MQISRQLEFEMNRSNHLYQFLAAEIRASLARCECETAAIKARDAGERALTLMPISHSCFTRPVKAVRRARACDNHHSAEHCHGNMNNQRSRGTCKCLLLGFQI